MCISLGFSCVGLTHLDSVGLYFVPWVPWWLPAMWENLPAMWESWVGSLGQEDPLEEGMATHSSILAWKIPMDKGT